MKKRELATLILFLGFLFSMTLGYLFLPKTEFSQTEKRYLQEAPDLNWKDLASGDWGQEAESYMADHIPGRDFFVGLNAYFELFTGRQVDKDVWLRGGKLLEAPLQKNESAIRGNMKVINQFAANIDRDVDLMLIPSAGWAAGEPEYQDESIIAEIYDLADAGTIPFAIETLFAGKPELYFDTDHHWTSAGAYTAYQHYMQAKNRTYRTEEAFEKTVHPDFRGSTYSRSALWLTPGEDLEIWQGSDMLTVTNGESEELHAGVHYWNRLEESDKYTVFLDGNHSIVRVRNPEAEGKILVIRDSYSNSLGCFLAESYEEVVLVDLRYYRQPVSELVKQENFDDVLVCYSLNQFLTDTNLVWLR